MEKGGPKYSWNDIEVKQKELAVQRAAGDVKQRQKDELINQFAVKAKFERELKDKAI